MKLKYYLFFTFIAWNCLHAATFTVTNTKDSGKGSLRQAIIDNNATPGLNNIVFDISGNGPFRIHPRKELDAITNPLAIDGSLVIEINGKGIGDGRKSGFGMKLMEGSDGSTISGLVLNDWSIAGLLLEASSNHVVQGNYIGTDITGLKPQGNGAAGLLIMAASGNQVINNIISGNQRHGIKISRSSGNIIQGNLIGLSAKRKRLSNMGSGIKIVASFNNLIGGTDTSAGNEIAFNEINGVEIGENIIDFDAQHNGILCNSIYANKVYGINFHIDTIHHTLGPNNLQAMPQLDSAKTSHGTTTIKGSLCSLDDQIFEIQFFSTPSPVLGQGKTYLGNVTVKSDAYGFGTFTFTTDDVGREAFITATSTQLDVLETSQFSRPRLAERKAKE